MTNPSQPAGRKELELLYPEIYNTVYPHVARAVDELVKTGHVPTAQSFQTAVDRIADASFPEEEALPVAAMSYNRPGRPGPGHPGPNRPGPNRPGGYRPRPPHHHNHSTVRDIAGILLLSELLGRR